MTSAYAINLIQQMIYTETEVVKQVNSRRGLTKKALKEERRAAKDLLFALLNRPPTSAEIDAAIR